MDAQQLNGVVRSVSTGPAPLGGSSSGAAGSGRPAVRSATLASPPSAGAEAFSETAAEAVATTATETGPEVSPVGLLVSQQGAASAPGTSMQEMIDAVAATVQLATREGVSQARLELRPAELGHVVIRLVQSGEGLRARVTAETPAAAQQLSQGRGELAHMLGSLKVSLLGLDIGYSGQRAPGEGAGRFGAGRTSGTGRATPAGEPDASQQSVSEPVAVSTASRALGEIVDVLA